MNYYSIYIQQYQLIAAPLYSLLTAGNSKRNVRFTFTGEYNDDTQTAGTFITKKQGRVKLDPKQSIIWGTEQEVAFQKLKLLVSQQPVLKLPDTSRGFQLWSDASDHSLGAILEQDGKPVEFWCRKLTPTQMSRYSTYQKEALSLAEAARRWRHWLHNGKVTQVYCDNKSLCQILSQKTTPDRVQSKLISILSELNTEIIHVPTTEQRADPLTRQTDISVVEEKGWSVNFNSETPIHSFHSSRSVSPAVCSHTHPGTDQQHPLSGTHHGVHAMSEVLAVDLSSESPTHSFTNNSCFNIPINFPHKHNTHCTVNPRSAQPKDSIIYTLIGNRKVDEQGNPVKEREEDISQSHPQTHPHPQAVNRPFADGTTVHKEAVKMLWQTAYESDEQLSPVFLFLLGRKVTGLQEEEVRKTYTLSGGLLFTEKFSPHKVVVPVSLRDQLVRNAHNLGIHYGVEKTLGLLVNYWWEGMRRTVQEYITGCPTCIRSKGKFHKEYGVPHPLISPTQPRIRIHVDLLEGLPECNGYSKLITCIDAFSRFAVAIPVEKGMDTDKFISLYKLHILPVFGPVGTVVTDAAKVLAGEEARLQFSLLNTELVVAAAFHHQSNGMVERLHKQINCMLRALCYQSGRTWLDEIGLILHTHNTHIHTALGTTPFALFFNCPPEGSLMDKWQEGFVPDPNVVQGLTIERWLLAKTRLETTMNQHNQALKAQMEKRRSQKTPVFQVGDQVWLRAQEFFPVQHQRFQPRVLGPFCIIETHPHDTYTLQVPTGSFDPKVHVSRLERFNSCVPTVAAKGIEFDEETRPQLTYLEKEFHGEKLATFKVQGKALLEVTKHGWLHTKNFGRVARYFCKFKVAGGTTEGWAPVESFVTGEGYVHQVWYDYIVQEGSMALPTSAVLRKLSIQWLIPALRRQ